MASTIIVEITPADHRGKNMCLMLISLLMGSLFGVILVLLTCDKNLDSGNWRLCILLSLIPSIFCLFLLTLYLDESPRYDLLYGNY